MQWDHLPGFKKTTELGEMLRLNVSSKTVLDEIARCDSVARTVMLYVRTGAGPASNGVWRS
jgi:hypothetical protein